MIYSVSLFYVTDLSFFVAGLSFLRGPMGFPGRDGMNGPAGAPGVQGPPGPRGSAGERGNQGERGLPGANGNNGKFVLSNTDQCGFPPSLHHH